MVMERLIACVKRHAFLYDSGHKDYKNISLKAAVWESIGKELNQSSDTVKAKWKTVRDGYTKNKKQLKDAAGSNKKTVQYLWSTQLSFLDNFIAPRSSDTVVKKEVITPSSSPHLTPNQDSDDSQDFKQALSTDSLPDTNVPFTISSPAAEKHKGNNVPSTSTGLECSISKLSNEPLRSARKRKDDGDVDKILNYLEKKKKKERDGIDHLFLSYSETFKKFPPREQALLKYDLAKLFADTELKLLRNDND